MLGRLLNLFRARVATSADDEEFRAFGVARSPKWPAERDRWLKDHPQCACCQERSDLEVHHKVPVHVDPSQELRRFNLLTLCRRCHLFVGHLARWSSWNQNVETDAAIWLAKIRNRPRKQ